MTPTRRAPTRSAKKRKAAKPRKPDRQVAEKHARQQAFLQAFEAIGTVTGAAGHVGVCRQQHYDWLAQDEPYAKAFAEAEVKSVDRLEEEARRRAVVGVNEPVFHAGKVVGHVRKRSDTLLMFLLNGRRSEVFKHRHEHTGKNGGPIQTQPVPMDLAALSESELSAYIQLQAKVEGREVPA